MRAEVLALIVDEPLPLIALPSLPLAFSVISRAVFRFRVGTMPTVTVTAEPSLF